jgi:hypothetical protein
LRWGCVFCDPEMSWGCLLAEWEEAFGDVVSELEGWVVEFFGVEGDVVFEDDVDVVGS